MSHRVGICSTCEANYKVPADFAADKAKCKSCGGVVEIGAVVDDPPPPPVPAKPVRKAEPELKEHVPSGKTGEGPSMMEQLRAQRKAERESQASPKLTAAPAPKRATPAGDETISSVGAPKARASSRKAAPSRTTRPSRSRRRRGGDDEDGMDEEDSGTRGRRGKKKSPLPLICTILLVVLGGGTGAYFALKGDPVDPVIAAKESIKALVNKQIRASNDEDADAYLATLDVEAVGEAAISQTKAVLTQIFEDYDLKYTLASLEFVSVKETEATARLIVETTKEAGPAFAENSVTTLQTFTKTSGGWLYGEGKLEKMEPLGGPEETERPKPTSNRRVKIANPMDVDLEGLADFGPAPGCDAARWEGLQEDAALLVDPQAGAAGGRAGKRLTEAGRLAIPALINVFKTRDMGSDAGFRDGDVLQRTLEKIYNGKNFGWKYSTEPNDHYYNRKVVENHWKLWDKYQSDEAGWLRFTGLDKEGIKPSSGGGADDLSTDELDALDDI